MLKGPEGRPFLGCECALWGADRQGSAPAHFVSGFILTQVARGMTRHRVTFVCQAGGPAPVQRPSSVRHRA